MSMDDVIARIVGRLDAESAARKQAADRVRGSQYRTITVRLTRPQFEALAGAVTRQDLELEAEHADGNSTTVERQVLARAWAAVRSAWFEADR